MSLSSKLNPDVVKTTLDDVFMQDFNPSMIPGWVDATSNLAFVQDSTDRAAVIEETFKGSGLWDEREEEGDVAGDDPRVDNKITFNVANFAKSIDISKNFFDDNMHGTYEKMVKDFANKGRVTMNDNAFKVYRDAFTNTLTADGVALVSDSHVTIGGDTVDNKLTAALAPASLDAAIVAMAEQKDQAGVVVGGTPATLLVPPALFKKAKEITDSVLASGTSNNDINIFSATYTINIITSNRLGTAVGGSDTAWFLLGDNHSVRRWVRQGLQTDLVDYIYSRNNSYVYKGEFREVVGASDYAGIIGSLGTT